MNSRYKTTKFFQFLHFDAIDKSTAKKAVPHQSPYVRNAVPQDFLPAAGRICYCVYSCSAEISRMISPIASSKSVTSVTFFSEALHASCELALICSLVADKVPTPVSYTHLTLPTNSLV